MIAYTVLLSVFLQSTADLLPIPDSCLIQITAASEDAEQAQPGQTTPNTTNTTVAPTPAPTAPPTPPTPAPEVKPGVPCECLKDACFQAYDRNGDAYLDADECALQEPLTNCSSPTWDMDGDGMVNFSVEWPAVFEMTNGSVCPVETEKEKPTCSDGYYLSGNPVTCEKCSTGATRRRRSFQCTECEAGYFDGGDFDDCVCQHDVYLSATSTPNGSTTFAVSTVSNLVVGDTITISSRTSEAAPEEDCGDEGCPVTSETAIIESMGPGLVLTIAAPLQNTFAKYSGIMISCTTTDGTELSRKHSPSCGGDEACGCKSTTCDQTGMCSIDHGNGTATCIKTGPYPIFPTPAPTVGAKGDPHLVNLQGEHFDINHAGDFVLLRIPQDPAKDAVLQLVGTVQPEFGKPCTTYITQVELSGSWLGNSTVQVRSYLQAHPRREGARLGARLLRPGRGAAPWQRMEDFLAHGPELELSAPQSRFNVTLSKSQWFPKKESSYPGAPTVSGMFTLSVRGYRALPATKIVIRQDLPEQEHLNLAVQRVSALGRMDVGGLLGFDQHPASLEYVSGKCEHHRATEKYRVESQEDNGYYYTPLWKQRWEEIKQQKQELEAAKGEGARDNEAAASLMGERDSSANLMCKCPTAGGPYAEGVIVEEQAALFAEASWD